MLDYMYCYCCEIVKLWTCFLGTQIALKLPRMKLFNLHSPFMGHPRVSFNTQNTQENQFGLQGSKGPKSFFKLCEVVQNWPNMWSEMGKNSEVDEKNLNWLAKTRNSLLCPELSRNSKKCGPNWTKLAKTIVILQVCLYLWCALLLLAVDHDFASGSMKSWSQQHIVLGYAQA